MKLKNKQRLTSYIVLALMLTCGAGYTEALGAEVIKVNTNDGTEAQPYSANTSLNSMSDYSGYKTVYGVYSSGTNSTAQNITTNIDLSSDQTIQSTGTDNDIKDIYGVYNEGGAKTNWVPTADTYLYLYGMAPNLRITGISNNGEGSQVITGGDESNLSVYVSGDSSNISNVNALSTPTPIATVIGIRGTNSASNEINLNSFMATGSSILQASSETETSSWYDTTTLAKLNATISDAADSYATILDNYDKYSDKQAYWDDLSKAQSAIDTAIESYKTIAAGVETIGISAENGAENNVIIATQLPVNSSLNLNLERTLSDENSTNAFAFKNIAMGIYGNNESKNSVTSDLGMMLTASSSKISDINNSSTGIPQTFYYTNELAAFGIRGENGSTNTFITPYDVSLSGSNTSSNTFSYKDDSSGTYINSDLTNFVGAYAATGANNNLQVGNLTANFSTLSLSNVIKNYSVNKSSSTQSLGSINVEGLEANTSGSNTATVLGDITAILNEATIRPSHTVYLSSSNSNFISDISSLTAKEINVRSISGNSSGNNIISADSINAQLGNYTASLTDNITDLFESPSVKSNYNDSVVNIADSYSGQVNIQAIYGNDYASNTVDAKTITAEMASASASLQDSVSNSGSTENTSNNDLSLQLNFKSPINIQSVYGSTYATNRVRVQEDISAKLSNFQASVSDSINDSDNSNNSTMSIINSYSAPVNVQSIYGTNYAFNDIDAKNISATLENFSASIYDNITKYNNSNNNNSNNNNLSHKLEYSVPINVQGIYGNNYAINQVKAQSTISAEISQISASLMDNFVNSSSPSNSSNFNIETVLNTPFTVQGIAANNHALNQIVAQNITSQFGSFNSQSISFNATFNDATDRGSISISTPIVVQGVYGNNEGVNVIRSNVISANAGASGSLGTINGSISPPSVGVFDVSWSAPVEVAGTAAENGAVNDITTDQIVATSSLLAQNIIDYSSNTPFVISSPVNVYGLLGTSNSITNLHSLTENGTVEVAVGINKNSDGTYDLSDLNNYGVYLDTATINLFNNVNITGMAVPSDVDTSSALNLSPITYLKNSSVNFVGYNDYYNPYYYNEDTDTYGKAISGSGVFHTYASSIGTLELQGTNNFLIHTNLLNSESDKLSFNSFSNNSSGTNYISVASDASLPSSGKGTIFGKTVVIAVANPDLDIETSNSKFIFDNADNSTTEVNFVGKTFEQENPLRVLKLTPTVETESVGTNRNVIITAIDYDNDTPAEGPKTAADSQLAMRNIGMIETDTLMHRMGDLRVNRAGNDGIWARFDRGNLDSRSGYNRSFNQTYNQLFIGYDRQHEYQHGKLYTGVAVGHVTGNVGYEQGTGSVKGTTIALYGTWLGDKGHYLDVVAKGGRISSDYTVFDSNNNAITANYGTPAYSLSAEYGYRKTFNSGYFIEPQAQLTFGRIQGVDYLLSNGVTIHQSGINSAVARVGILGGKQFGPDKNAYFKASILKNLGGSGNVSGYYGTDSLALEVTDGNSTWVELGVGANIRMSENSSLYFDVLKTFGGNVTQKWQFSVGSSFKF